MTNEEAIKILGQYDVSDLHFYTTDGEEILFTEWSDAIEMAISALKAQSKHSQNTSSKQPDLETLGMKTGETCEDVISRRDAIDAILADKIDAISLKVMTALGEGRFALTLNSACDRHIRDIEKLPSAKPERKTGEWISDGPSYIGGYDWMHCSECGHKEIDCPAGRTNYCPNCGAKMK